MGIPVIFLSFLVFIIIYRIQLAKLDKDQNAINKLFWEREESSLFVRKKEIKPYELILPNVDSIPTYSQSEYEAMGNKDLFNIQEKCITYSHTKMLNTSHLLNSEVRLKYGSANIDTVEDYEENYHQYIKLLYQLGKGFFELNRLEDAILLLEEGLHVNTEISDHLILLGKLYKTTNQKEKFTALFNYANTINSLTKNKILHELEALT
jgi:tetratricopeptide (TPR) repeat protein